ncbi:MAG TPA: HAMP domain-containing histidine kinase [Epsilonproteobacteria bacterium]|nr:HAMP domain-containing histidine kinase [Campylobacterota bacterium]
MTISKEKVIVLTSYERISLFRFLSVYLVSVFVLLSIIGYLFFENNRTSMKSAMKFEMMYQARMLSSKIVMKSMENNESVLKNFDKGKFLKDLKHCRFKAGYYNKNKKPLYTEINNVSRFDTDFFVDNMKCYTVTEDKSDHLGIRYIVLKESDLAKSLHKLRIKIIGYLVLSFILMGVVGYFLGRLFLQPVREQIESLDQFISDTTHELNTPISAILMTIQSLKNVEPKKMKRLEASAKRLSTMYGSLTYRLEGGVEPSEDLCLAKIVEERIEFIKELIESKRLDIEMDLDATKIHMPKRSVHRLIDNLISNAIKYSDVGDTITVTLKNNVLKVKDTGIGIDEKMQEDIFRRYYRANDERGGFGIGLNIVLSICKRYKIKLALESKKGEGSTFKLTFPKIK